MPNYEETALKIIKDAIKSAIFIDENAREPFMAEEPGEAMRSEELYKDFRAKGISLSIYKYDDATYDAHKEYLFNNRDLVLLDWKLDGEAGEDKSLMILSDIIRKQPHIHFCVIYTSEQPDIVFNNILSFFSGVTKDECDEICIEFAEHEETIAQLSSSLLDLRRYHLIKNKRKDILARMLEDGRNKALNEKIRTNPSYDYYDYVKIGVAFSKDLKSQYKEQTPIDIAPEAKSLCINNTIVTVFNKDQISADQIYGSFSQQVAQYDKGVMHLVGLEMRNIQRKGGTFIDSNVLAVTKETLGYHKMQSDEGFSRFIKDVMVEHLKTNIKGDDISIISAISPCEYQEKLESEYAAMNVFYNSQNESEDNKILSFGDVFTDGDKYYICITALCDCARPKKRDNCFYFVEGFIISRLEALKKGDEGYISYISPELCIRWDNGASNGEYSHIVPVNYWVPDNHIVEKKLKLSRFKDDGPKECEFIYITTIRQNYAQRIANFAFTHPVRVGIDFVKK